MIEQALTLPRALAADLAAYENTVALIVARRPDLEAAEVMRQIQRLAESTPHSCRSWADRCLSLAYKVEPMPWEARPGLEFA